MRTRLHGCLVALWRARHLRSAGGVSAQGRARPCDTKYGKQRRRGRGDGARDDGPAATPMTFSTIPQAIKSVRKGEMLIVVDDPKRENEGDFFIPAERATPRAIAMM